MRTGSSSNPTEAFENYMKRLPDIRTVESTKTVDGKL